jgi:hypothetical protein
VNAKLPDPPRCVPRGDGVESPGLPSPPGTEQGDRRPLLPVLEAAAAGGTPAGEGSGLHRPALSGRPQAPGARVGGKSSRVPGSSPVADAMSEAELEEGIRALCKDLGILRFHVKDSRGTNAGLPDDILIGPGGVLWRECKTQKGQLTNAQWAVANALNLAGQDWNTWRPADLLSGQIARELAALAGFGGAA